MAVVLVTADGAPSNEPVVAIDGRVIQVTLASSKPSEHAELNRALRGLGLIRPLMWLEDPLQEAWFCRSYAPFKAISLRERGAHGFERALFHADAVLVVAPTVAHEDLPREVEERTWVLSAEPTAAQAAEFCRRVAHAVANRPPAESRLNVAILYDHTATYTNTVQEYLAAFAQYSQHRVFYLPASNYHPSPPANV